MPLQMPLEVETFAESLAMADYATGYFGKWHLGGAGFSKYLAEITYFDSQVGELADLLAALRAQLDSWMMRQGDAGQATEMKALERMPRNKGGEKQAKEKTQ